MATSQAAEWYHHFDPAQSQESLVAWSCVAVLVRVELVVEQQLAGQGGHLGEESTVLGVDVVVAAVLSWLQEWASAVQPP